MDLTPFSRTCTFTVSGYQGTTALEGFPVLIRLSESISGFSYADCAADGADLRFTDATGELLPHEIDTWDASGESTVWVKVPTLSGTATAIRLYYGVNDLTTLPAVNARDVWTKYITVVHGGTGFADSSPKAHRGERWRCERHGHKRHRGRRRKQARPELHRTEHTESDQEQYSY